MSLREMKGWDFVNRTLLEEYINLKMWSLSVYIISKNHYHILNSNKVVFHYITVIYHIYIFYFNIITWHLGYHCHVSILLTSSYLCQRNLTIRYNKNLSKLWKWIFMIDSIILKVLEFIFKQLPNFMTFGDVFFLKVVACHCSPFFLRTPFSYHPL